MTERRRLLELALRALELEQVRLQQEMQEVRAELGLGNAAPRLAARTGGSTRHASQPQRTAPNKGTKMTLAQRKKISAALKQRWAERRKAVKAA